MKAYCKLDTLRPSFSLKCRVLSSLLSRSPRATPDLNLWLLFLMSRKHSSWKDNEIINCHLLTRDLPRFSVGQLFDGLTRWWMSSPRFSLVDAFKLCHTLNPLNQLHKQWILRNVLSTALAKNHAKPAKGDTSHVTKMNIFCFSQLIMS